MRIRFIVLIALLALTALAADTAPVVKPKFPLGKDTTYFNAPLRDDGSVNYVKAIEAQLTKGVTRENNAFFTLLPLLGVYEGNLSKRYRDHLIARFNLEESQPLWIDVAQGAPDEDAREKINTQLVELSKKPWTKAEYPEFAEYLASVDEPLAMITDASKLERYALPFYAGDDDDYAALSYPRLSLFRDMANVLCARATYRLGKGDTAGCQRDILTAHRFGRLLTQGSSSVENLLGMAIDVKAARTDATLAIHGKLSAKAIAAHIRSLQDLPEIRPITDTIPLGERCLTLDTLTQIARHGHSHAVEVSKMPAYAFLQDQEAPKFPLTAEQLEKVDFVGMLKKINTHFDDLIAAMKIEDYTKQTAAIADVEKKLLGARTSVHPRPIADKDISSAFSDWYFGYFIYPIGRAAAVECRMRVQYDLAILSLNLAAYKADQGEYPENLEALAPKYLAKIPNDRFTGKPLIYKRTPKGFLLYSLSDDQKDDNGTPLQSGKGDIVINAETR